MNRCDERIIVFCELNEQIFFGGADASALSKDVSTLHIPVEGCQHSFEIPQHLRGILIPIRGLLGHRSGDHGRDVLGQIGSEFPRIRCRHFAVTSKHFLHIRRTLKWGPACNEMEPRGAKRINITSMIDQPAAALFGTHVVRCPDDAIVSGSG